MIPKILALLMLIKVIFFSLRKAVTKFKEILGEIFVINHYWLLLILYLGGEEPPTTVFA